MSEISAFIDRSERIVIVGKVFGVSLCACCVAELNISEFLSSLDHVIFMAERVSKNYIAAFVNEIGGSLIALV